MINISRNNYEEYFLDFHDGQLSPDDEKNLFSFLDKNPDLKEELGHLEKNSRINKNKNVLFVNKNALKKTSIFGELTEDNFDELCIAMIEDDLNENEKLKFNEFLKIASRQKDLELYKLTKLSPEYSIIFKDKPKIKKQVGNTYHLKKNYKLISVAASIIILIALYLFIPREITENNEFLVQDIPSIKTEDDFPEVKPEDKKGEVERMTIINTTNRDIKEELYIQKHEIETAEVLEKRITGDYLVISDLLPVGIMLDVENLLEIKEISPVLLDMNNPNKEEATKYMSVKTFLASTFNKTVLKKENKDRIEFFDIAQAGVKGINKLTGSNMKLERKYDKNGIPDKTEFNSRLVAFSTPIKKD